MTDRTERPPLIEDRTITNLAELQDFCGAAAAAVHTDPADVRLHIPQNMRVIEVTRPNGTQVYYIAISAAA